MRSLIVPVLFTVVAACGGIGPDERSGGDSGRGDAKPAALDTLLYDRVSLEQGDATDWKKFEIEDAVKAKIKLWWDDPKAIGAVVELRDQGGDKIADLKHDRTAASEILGPVKLKEGVYFLRVKASGGASVYSYEISTGSGDSGDPVPDI